MKINEVTEKHKAGIIPYYVKDGQILMKFMIPSNPAYGGTSPQVAKGEIDPGEDGRQAAVREGVEELGLVASNIVQLFPAGTIAIKGMKESYIMAVFVAEIKDPNMFSKPHYETGSTMWLTMEQFAAQGRQNQKQIVQHAHELMLSADGRDQVS